jgi:hypothetical protein
MAATFADYLAVPVRRRLSKGFSNGQVKVGLYPGLVFVVRGISFIVGGEDGNGRAENNCEVGRKLFIYSHHHCFCVKTNSVVPISSIIMLLLHP